MLFSFFSLLSPAPGDFPCALPKLGGKVRVVAVDQPCEERVFFLV
jgi:hypothetical protein